MTLPKIKTQVFETELPSTGEPIKYRPFTVAEEKLFLLAQSDDDVNKSIEAITRVMQNCILSPEDLDIMKLTSYDIEILVLKLRKVSVGEDTTINIIDEETGKEHEVKIDFNDVKLFIPENHEHIIPIADNISVKLKDLSLKEMITLEKMDVEEQEKIYEMIHMLIINIIEGDKVYVKGVDFNDGDEDFQEFLMSIPSTSSKKFMDFIETMPKVQIIVNIPDTDRKITVEGIGNILK